MTSKINCAKCKTYLIGITVEHDIPTELHVVKGVAMHVDGDDIYTLECPNCGEFTPSLPLLKRAIEQLRQKSPETLH